MASTSARILKTKVVFKGPGLQVNGLEAVPEGLWLSDQQDNRTYLVDYDGKVLTSFPSPARNASGTSFGAGSVWIASNVRPSMIYRHDPQTGHCLAGIHLPNAETGGVHGIQWRPYGPNDTIPGADRARAGAAPDGARRQAELRPRHQRHALGDPARRQGRSTTSTPRPASFWARSRSRCRARTAASGTRTDGTISVAETFEGHIFRLDPKDGEVMDVSQIQGIEVHGLTKSADGRIWIGDAATNLVSVVEP